MDLTRCQDQKPQTVDDFNAELAQVDEWAKVGRTMLALITRLRVLLDNRQIYGLTSLWRFFLLAEDTYRSTWFVECEAIDTQHYFVSYLMPEHLASWHRAYVTGEAYSEDEAVQMILIAMDASVGWHKAA